MGSSIRSGNWNRVGLVGGLVRGVVVDWKVVSIDEWSVPIPQCILSSRLSLVVRKRSIGSIRLVS